MLDSEPFAQLEAKPQKKVSKAVSGAAVRQTRRAALREDPCSICIDEVSGAGGDPSDCDSLC